MSILPRDGQAEVALAELSGQPYVVMPLYVAERPPACRNCMDSNFLFLRVLTGGPYLSTIGSKKPVTWWRDGWWTVESKVYLCPLCSDPQARIANLWETCGLEVNEREWRLDFLRGIPGKQAALKAGNQILAGCPRPTGWTIFWGDYGMGKSGVLISLVTAFVRAGVPARYVRAGDILAEIRASYGDDARLDEVELENIYGSQRVLAIDEIDRISDTSWSRSTLMMLLDSRYKRRGEVCTILATNSNPDDMPSGFEYLQSRLSDGERVMLSGVTLRGKDD